jgi:hypothetical protein
MVMAHPRKVCNCCNQNRRYEFFPRANGRRRDTCKECYAGKTLASSVTAVSASKTGESNG